jgi:high-affinity iron transporter
MRGTIEVVEPGAASVIPAPAEPPLFQQLGIDLDAMRHADNVPSNPPSAARGAELGLSFPAELVIPGRLRELSPLQVFEQLRGDTSFDAYSDAQLWDAVAYLYRAAASPESITRGRQLFARDCAACHGETGRGDGVAGRDLPGLSVMDPQMKRGPADFTDPQQMLTASDVLLEGKLLRGGMGTGMPEFGSLYSEQDRWDVIAYIRTFALP